MALPRALLARHAFRSPGNVSRFRPLPFVSTNQHSFIHIKVDPLVDLDNQSIPMPDGSRILRLKGGQQPDMKPFIYEDARTVYDTFLKGMTRAGGDSPFLGARQRLPHGKLSEYKWISYKEAQQRSLNIGRGLRELGIPAGQDVKLGMYMKNRPEWMLIDHMCCAFSNVSVPIYSTFATWAVKHIIKQCDMEVVFCEDVNVANKVLECKSEVETLKKIIVLDNLSDAFKKAAKAKDIDVLSLEELELIGAKAAGKHHISPPKPSDLYTICYTSGTTDSPKGVMITHENAMSAVTNSKMLPNLFKLVLNYPDFTYFSFLPFAHVFDRMIELNLLNYGARFAFYSGDLKELASDMQAARPHFIIAVPRVLDKAYAKVQAELAKSSMKNFLFKCGIMYKEHLLKKGYVSNETIVDKVLFKKIRDSFGGRLHQLIIGSAPTNPEVLKFARAALGCLVIEGYGMTETCTSLTMNNEGEWRMGSVGSPLNNTFVKIIDAKECGYEAAKNGGEILVKGHNVTKGYYKDEARTREIFDQDGWLKTGDIGQWTEYGTLKIVDRKKNIFKLSQGEYIAPEKIENVYKSLEIIEQCCVHGQTDKSCVVGIISPEPEAFSLWCNSQAHLSGTMEELCKCPRANAAVIELLHKRGKEAELRGFEQVKAIYLTSEPFTVDNDQLTPTMKVQRKKIAKVYKNEIAEMYDRLESEENTKKTENE